MDLVTGGAGYLGSHVARALLAQGRRVRIFDIQRTACCPPDAELVQGDMAEVDHYAIRAGWGTSRRRPLPRPPPL